MSLSHRQPPISGPSLPPAAAGKEVVRAHLATSRPPDGSRSGKGLPPSALLTVSQNWNILDGTTVHLDIF